MKRWEASISVCLLTRTNISMRFFNLEIDYISMRDVMCDTDTATHPCYCHFTLV